MSSQLAKCRQCRREGAKLFLKGEKCDIKCTFVKRGYVPGQHGLSRRRKPSDYSVMLREKQKVKRIYGMQEKQFSNYFVKASSMDGITGENLLTILESRLDNVIYRMGFAASRSQARQLASHGIFAVNGRRTTIPSVLLRAGDTVSVLPGKAKSTFFEKIKESKTKAENTWVEADLKNLKGVYKNAPIREQLDSEINEQLIVEFYSK